MNKRLAALSITLGICITVAGWIALVFFGLILEKLVAWLGADFMMLLFLLVICSTTFALEIYAWLTLNNGRR